MKTLLKQLALMIVGWLINQVDNTDIREAGITAGKWLTDNARERLGDDWEGVEEKLQNKAAVFMGGVGAGLDYDDGE